MKLQLIICLLYLSWIRCRLNINYEELENKILFQFHSDGNESSKELLIHNLSIFSSEHFQLVNFKSIILNSINNRSNYSLKVNKKKNNLNKWKSPYYFCYSSYHSIHSRNRRDVEENEKIEIFHKEKKSKIVKVLKSKRFIIDCIIDTNDYQEHLPINHCNGKSMKLIWTFNSDNRSLCNESNRYLIDEKVINGNQIRSKLIIERLTASDEGNYKCQLFSNRSIVDDIQLKVIGVPSPADGVSAHLWINWKTSDHLQSKFIDGILRDEEESKISILSYDGKYVENYRRRMEKLKHRKVILKFNIWADGGEGLTQFKIKHRYAPLYYERDKWIPSNDIIQINVSSSGIVDSNRLKFYQSNSRQLLHNELTNEKKMKEITSNNENDRTIKFPSGGLLLMGEHLLPTTENQFNIILVNRIGKSVDSGWSNNVTLPREPPNEPPRNIELIPISDTIIEVQWNEPKQSGWNSNSLKLYQIDYCMTMNEIECTTGAWSSIDVPINGKGKNSFQIQYLMKWSQYMVRIAAVNDLGIGIFSYPPQMSRTKEGAPDRPVSNVKFDYVQRRSIDNDELNEYCLNISWRRVSYSVLNGKLKGHRIILKPFGEWAEYLLDKFVKRNFHLFQLMNETEKMNLKNIKHIRKLFQPTLIYDIAIGHNLRQNLFHTICSTTPATYSVMLKEMEKGEFFEKNKKSFMNDTFLQENSFRNNFHQMNFDIFTNYQIFVTCYTAGGHSYPEKGVYQMKDDCSSGNERGRWNWKEIFAINNFQLLLSCTNNLYYTFDYCKVNQWFDENETIDLIPSSSTNQLISSSTYRMMTNMKINENENDNILSSCLIDQLSDLGDGTQMELMKSINNRFPLLSCNEMDVVNFSKFIQYSRIDAPLLDRWTINNIYILNNRTYNSFTVLWYSPKQLFFNIDSFTFILKQSKHNNQSVKRIIVPIEKTFHCSRKRSCFHLYSFHHLRTSNYYLQILPNYNDFDLEQKLLISTIDTVVHLPTRDNSSIIDYENQLIGKFEFLEKDKKFQLHLTISLENGKNTNEFYRLIKSIRLYSRHNYDVEWTVSEYIRIRKPIELYFFRESKNGNMLRRKSTKKFDDNLEVFEENNFLLIKIQLINLLFASNFSDIIIAFCDDTKCLMHPTNNRKDFTFPSSFNYSSFSFNQIFQQTFDSKSKLRITTKTSFPKIPPGMIFHQFRWTSSHSFQIHINPLTEDEWNNRMKFKRFYNFHLKCGKLINMNYRSPNVSGIIHRFVLKQQIPTGNDCSIEINSVNENGKSTNSIKIFIQSADVGVDGKISLDQSKFEELEKILKSSMKFEINSTNLLNRIKMERMLKCYYKMFQQDINSISHYSFYPDPSHLSSNDYIKKDDLMKRMNEGKYLKNCKLELPRNMNIFSDLFQLMTNDDRFHLSSKLDNHFDIRFNSTIFSQRINLENLKEFKLINLLFIIIRNDQSIIDYHQIDDEKMKELLIGNDVEYSIYRIPLHDLLSKLFSDFFLTFRQMKKFRIFYSMVNEWNVTSEWKQLRMFDKRKEIDGNYLNENEMDYKRKSFHLGRILNDISIFDDNKNKFNFLELIEENDEIRHLSLITEKDEMNKFSSKSYLNDHLLIRIYVTGELLERSSYLVLVKMLRYHQNSNGHINYEQLKTMKFNLMGNELKNDSEKLFYEIPIYFNESSFHLTSIRKQIRLTFIVELLKEIEFVSDSHSFNLTKFLRFAYQNILLMRNEVIHFEENMKNSNKFIGWIEYGSVQIESLSHHHHNEMEETNEYKCRPITIKWTWTSSKSFRNHFLDNIPRGVDIFMIFYTKQQRNDGTSLLKKIRSDWIFISHVSWPLEQSIIDPSIICQFYEIADTIFIDFELRIIFNDNQSKNQIIRYSLLTRQVNENDIHPPYQLDDYQYLNDDTLNIIDENQLYFYDGNLEINEKLIHLQLRSIRLIENLLEIKLNEDIRSNSKLTIIVIGKSSNNHQILQTNSIFLITNSFNITLEHFDNLEDFQFIQLNVCYENEQNGNGWNECEMEEINLKLEELNLSENFKNFPKLSNLTNESNRGYGWELNWNSLNFEEYSFFKLNYLQVDSSCTSNRSIDIDGNFMEKSQSLIFSTFSQFPHMDQMRRIVFSKENIEPNKNYLISIDLFERKKNGKLIVNNSPFFPFRQIETNSSEVINLRTKYVSYGSALLLWELPTEPNGIIKSFQIIINRLISNNQSIIEQKSIYPVNIKKITSNCPDKIMKRNQREFSVFISSLPNEKRFEVNIFPISLTNLFGKSNFVSFKTKPSNMIIRSHLTLSFKFDIYYQLNSTTRISEKKYEEFSDLMRYMNRSVEDFLNLSDRSVNEIINGYVMFDMKENSMKRKRSIEKYDDCELIEMNKDGNSLDISLTAQKIYNRKKYFILQLLHKISSFSFEWKTISLSDKSCVILPINSISTFYDARMILVNGSGTIFSSDNHSPSIHINGSSNNNTKFSIYLNEWMRKLDSRRLNLYNQQRRLHRLTLSQRIEQTIYQQWYIYMIAAIALIFILTILTFSCSKKQRKSKRARNQRSKRINSKESSLNSGSTTITMNTTNNMSNRQYRNTLLMNKNNNNNNNFNDIKTSNYIGDCESVDDDIEVLHRKHISTLDKSNAYSHIGTTRSIDGKLYTTEEENDAIAYVFNVPSNNPANILTLHTTKSTNSSTNSNENNPSSNGTGLSFLPLPNSSQLTNGHNNGYRTMNKNEHENGVYGRKLELINDYGQGASSLYQTTRTLERNGGMSSSDETDDGDNRLQHTLNRLNAKNYTTMQRSRMKMLTRPQSNTMGNNNKQMNQIQIDNDEGGEEDGENKEKLSFFHRFSRRSKRKKEKKKDSNNLQSHSQSTFCESKKDLVDECQMNSSINNDYSKRTSSLHRQQQQQQQQLQCQMNNLNEKNCHVMPQNQLLILNTKEPTTQLISTSINNSQMLMKNNNQKNNNQSIVVNTNGMNNDNCKYFQYLQTMVQNPASNQRDNFYAINMNTLQQQQQQQQKKNNNNQFQSNNFISSNQQQSNPNQNTLLLINRNGMMRKSFDNGLSSMNDKKQMNNSTSETHNTFGRQMNDTVPAFITNNPSNQFAKQTSNTIYDGMLSFSNTPLRKTMQNSHRPNHQTMKPTMPTTPQSQKSQNAYLTINSRILDDFNKTEFLNGSKKHNLPSNNLLRDFVHDDEETSTIHTGFSGYSDAGNSSVYKASSSIRKTDHLQYSTTGTCNNEKAYAPPPLMSNHQMQPVFSSNDSWKFVNNKKTNKNKSIGTLPPPHISLQPNKINEKNQINDKNQIDGMMDKKNKSFLPNLKSNDTPSTPPPPYSSTIDPSPISSSNTKDYLYSRYQQHYPLQTESNTDSAIML